jgi:hypothetical protein
MSCFPSFAKSFARMFANKNNKKKMYRMTNKKNIFAFPQSRKKKTDFAILFLTKCSEGFYKEEITLRFNA